MSSQRLLNLESQHLCETFWNLRGAVWSLHRVGGQAVPWLNNSKSLSEDNFLNKDVTAMAMNSSEATVQTYCVSIGWEFHSGFVHWFSFVFQFSQLLSTLSHLLLQFADLSSKAPRVTAKPFETGLARTGHVLRHTARSPTTSGFTDWKKEPTNSQF